MPPMLDLVQARINDLLADWRKRHPDVPDAYYGAVVADDSGTVDDGDYGRDEPQRPEWITQDERGWRKIGTLK